MNEKVVKQQKYFGIELAFLAQFVSVAFGYVYELYVSFATTNEAFTAGAFMFLTFPLCAMVFLVWNDKKMKTWIYFVVMLIFSFAYLYINETAQYQTFTYKVIRFITVQVSLTALYFYSIRAYVDEIEEEPLVVKIAYDGPEERLKKKRLICGVSFFVLNIITSVLMGAECEIYGQEKDYESSLIMWFAMSTLFCVTSIILILKKKSTAYVRILAFDLLVVIFGGFVIKYGADKFSCLLAFYLISCFLCSFDGFSEIFAYIKSLHSFRNQK